MAGTSEQYRDALQQAAAGNALVRIARTVESGTANGYVVGVGPEFFLLCVVNAEILFNGFQAFRLDDLEQIWSPAPHHVFAERALALGGRLRPSAPPVDLTSLAALLRSAAGCFPLITVHRERADPDVCHIGRMVVVSETTVTLREISPDATWYEGTGTYELRDITRVDFGGLYEDALAVVNQAT